MLAKWTTLQVTKERGAVDECEGDPRGWPAVHDGSGNLLGWATHEVLEHDLGLAGDDQPAPPLDTPHSPCKSSPSSA